MTREDVRIEFLEDWDPDAGAALLQSAREAHGSDYRGVDWLRWKFAESPFGPAIVCLARTASGQVAGAVVFGRWRLTFGDQDIEAAVSYETFVHPDFQRRGLFVALAEAAAKRAGEEGIEILFNFPNPASKPGFLKLGWRDLGGIQTWVRPQEPLRVFAAVLKDRKAALGALVAEPAATDPKKVALPRWVRDVSSERHDGVLVSARSEALLRWRYWAHPTFRYEHFEAAGLGCIYRVGSRGGVREAQVMDILPAEPASAVTASAIRRLLRSLALARGFQAYSMVTTPGTALAAALPWAGFVQAPNRASFLCLPLSDRLRDIRDNRQWALTTTDIHTF